MKWYYLYILSFVNSVLVNYFVMRCCKIPNAKFKLLACNAITNIYFNVGKQIEETKPLFWTLSQRLYSR